jgi:SAM-dependent methyltransferase
MTNDRYAKFDYSRLISWDQRITREWPFLEELFRSAPSRRILDLGSGTGEHARFLAGEGFEVVGLDASPAMVAKARETPGKGVRFVEGDMREIASLVEGRFGAALCLGNALPHLTGEDDLTRLASGLRAVLLTGAPVVLQILNYGRIEAKRERSLPLSFLADPDDPEARIVFLRLIEMHSDRRVTFMPTILRQRPDREPPVELLASERVEIRGWRQDEIERAFAGAGFGALRTWGSYQGAPFEPEESRDVIFVARSG